MAERKTRSRYGEKTIAMRIPVSMVPEVEQLLRTRELLALEWARAVAPPLSKRLASFLVDRAMDSSDVLIGALQDQGGQFGLVAERLRAEFEKNRADYESAALGELVALLHDDISERVKQ